MPGVLSRAVSHSNSAANLANCGNVIALPGRSPALPSLYELESHPQVPIGSAGRIILWLQDRTLPGASEVFMNSGTFKIPRTPHEVKERGEREGHLKGWSPS